VFSRLNPIKKLIPRKIKTKKPANLLFLVFRNKEAVIYPVVEDSNITVVVI
jgi:hypothetical protein